ncbi:MAG: hypothetical protein KJZ80_20380 [Hyphomicrobiaceae bacterium]|nr:hypothetical protein [Hyphomicrobiaceae bacterium]
MTQLARGQTPERSTLSRRTGMKVRIAFNGASMTATLCDNPSARDFASMLPLDLRIDDYSTNEKIAYLPRKLTEEGSGPFDNERPGDLGYYSSSATWRPPSMVVSIPADLLQPRPEYPWTSWPVTMKRSVSALMPTAGSSGARP